MLSRINKRCQSWNWKLILISLYGKAAVGRATPESREKKKGNGKFKSASGRLTVAGATGTGCG
ncbi:280R [Invertebrate iridescent virus 6]|uniref:280R n=1 Tax=Invertebrate iridescent virus 6 TaxID=176652 RepID=Q91FP4_IIV6|nr:280R [Invertebrate iridescent virus 6]AAK82141.1 280R [Invertebrate iridescent virus 6]QMS79720.1 hypothetical protein IIV6-T1_275 [Invertebrate iridescent virus 6]